MSDNSSGKTPEILPRQIPQNVTELIDKTRNNIKFVLTALGKSLLQIDPVKGQLIFQQAMNQIISGQGDNLGIKTMGGLMALMLKELPETVLSEPLIYELI